LNTKNNPSGSTDGSSVTAWPFNWKWARPLAIALPGMPIAVGTSISRGLG
jgi:hypothetical protein